MSATKQAPIKAAQDALMRGDMALTQVLPAAIRTILDEKLWEGRVDSHGNPFSCFREFAEHPFWEGLNVQPYDRLNDYCKGDADLIVRIREAGKRKRGPNNNRYNITETGRGTAQAATLERLQKEFPKHYERVKAGELSAHAAAIEAGFRKPTRSIPIDSPESAMRALLRVFSKENLKQALEEL